MKILLLLTTGMSLKMWDSIGVLSRELHIYATLSKYLQSNILIYSYGNNDSKYINGFDNITVISKTYFFKSTKYKLLNKLLNYSYNIISLFKHYETFSEISIIKTNQFSGSLWGVILKIIFNKILIVRMGYYYTHRSANKFSLIQMIKEFVAFNIADLIVVSSPVAEKYISEKYNVKKKLLYIPNYIDTNIFKPIDSTKKYDITYVGRLDKRKNLNLLLSAVKGLGLKLLFIGSGPEKNLLMSTARNNGVDLDIICRVDNHYLSKYYNETKLFVLLSKYEGNPKALLEAMACGCTVIAANVDGIREIIDDRSNGLLCNDDEEVIRMTIIKTISNDTYREFLGANARRYVVNNNDLFKLINVESNIMRKLLTMREY
jgi:glycosyltransferase involved in cell wall biosynthesis